MGNTINNRNIQENKRNPKNLRKVRRFDPDPNYLRPSEGKQQMILKRCNF